MDKSSSQLTTLGKIGAAHGIKGWVRLISFTDPAHNILDFRHFYLSANTVAGSQQGPASLAQLEKVEIDESRSQGKHFVAHIKGCDSREQAVQLTGRTLQVPIDALPALPEDEYYWYQLEGLTVINQEAENLGKVHHLLQTGANDVLVVQPTAQSIDDEERLIPYVREQYVKEIDVDAGIIRADWKKEY